MFWTAVALGIAVLLLGLWLVDRKRRSRGQVVDPTRHKSMGHLLGEDENLYGGR